MKCETGRTEEIHLLLDGGFLKQRQGANLCSCVIKTAVLCPLALSCGSALSGLFKALELLFLIPGSSLKRSNSNSANKMRKI